jgi:BirA family biotin operon repressor/biotin-[acetyl-CoA-carboxylase] ligase
MWFELKMEAKKSQISALGWRVLAQLESGEALSLDDLSRQLTADQAALFNQLKHLDRLGVGLSKIANEYRLDAKIERLDESMIRHYLANVGVDRPPKLQILNLVDSTNSEAKKLLEAGAESGTVVLAEGQTRGRGRRGNTWISPFAANIYMSLVWRFDHDATVLEGLSLAIGVAVRRAILTFGVDNIGLKWPNDIYANDKKLGGILLEVIGDPSVRANVVIGVGINVNMSEGLGRDIDQQWIDLNSISPSKVSRNALAANLMASIFGVLKNFSEAGFSAYRDEWQCADCMRGLPVSLNNPHETIYGTVLGVDNSGALRLLQDGGTERHFIGGEMSLRKQL